MKEELGYTVDYIVVDGKGYVPQHRERIYIAGFLKDTGFKFSNFEFQKPNEGPKLSSILHNDNEVPEAPYTVSTNTKKTIINEKYTLTEKLWNYLQAYAEKHRKKGNGEGKQEEIVAKHIVGLFVGQLPRKVHAPEEENHHCY